MHDLTSDRIRARLIESPAGPATPEERRNVSEQRFAILQTEIDRRRGGGKAADAPWATPSMSAEGIVQAAFQALRYLSDEAVIHLIAMSQLLWTRFGNTPGTITATVTTASTAMGVTTTRTTKKICEHGDQTAPLRTRTWKRETTDAPSGPDDSKGLLVDEQSSTVVAR
ncbi:hypothetical protein ACIOTI_41475 [Streptomyces sp. NPDC087843]|uniref:hypothetical protein n=1 Tax=Streptomyces sp. NPDC087843 TaxID=3365804 RepID=UPI0038174FB4